MKRNDRVFIFMICVAVGLCVLLMAKNIISHPLAPTKNASRSSGTPALHEDLMKNAPPLHEARYWRSLP